MISLRVLKIRGDKSEIKELLEEFGDVRVNGCEPVDMHDNPSFTLTRRLQNFYVDSEGEAPLWVLVPDRKIDDVWPGPGEDYLTIKVGTWGTAERTGLAVALHRPNLRGLYLCLSPDGEAITEIGCLGI